MAKRSDLYYTPPESLQPLLPYLKAYQHVWECAAGQGHMAMCFEKHGFKVTQTDIATDPCFDFLTCAVPDEIDLICTNPPFSKKREFLARCYELGKPFVLLLPLNCLETKGIRAILSKQKFSLLLPAGTIDYIVPDLAPGKKSKAFFYSCFVTNIPDLPTIVFLPPL